MDAAVKKNSIGAFEAFFYRSQHKQTVVGPCRQQRRSARSRAPHDSRSGACKQAAVLGGHVHGMRQ